MKRAIQISALIIFIWLVVFPQAAMSEVRISLKNGRDIIADNCNDSKDRLVCEKMGGLFEIDKKDVVDVRQVTIYKNEDSETSTPKENPTSIEEDSGDLKDSGSNDSEPPVERGGRR